MEISYLGNSSYKIKSKSGVVIMDPEKKGAGDIVTISQAKNKSLDGQLISGTARRKKPFVISEPGEYEIESISIFGYGTSAKNTAYIVQTEDLRIAHLGVLDGNLDKKMITLLEGVDVLVVPVGSEGEVKNKDIVELVGKVEPTYAIIMSDKQESVKLVEMLGKTVKEVSLLSINKSTLPMDLSEVVVFE